VVGPILGSVHDMNKTLSANRELGPKHYRETSGLYYEDFEIGDTFEHRPGRTITDVDNIWMTLLTMNVHPSISMPPTPRKQNGERCWSTAL
jgi:hypothetical protein